MDNQAWTPDRSLLENGWHFFSLISKDNREFRDIQLNRFLDTIVIESEYGKGSGEEYNEMYVKAYLGVPTKQNPGGGFIQVGCRERDEPVDEKYLSSLKEIFKQTIGREVRSVLVLPEHYYVPSSVVKGQFEKVSAYDKIVWMR